MKGRLLSRKGRSSSLRERRSVLNSSKLQELRTAKELGGDLVSGSGNQWHSKGDVKAKRYLVECKRTDKKSYSLKAEDLEKLRVQAHKAGKNPLFQVELGKERLAILPWELLLDLLVRAGDREPQVEGKQRSVARRR